MRQTVSILTAAFAATMLLACAGSGEKQAAVVAPAMAFSSAERDIIMDFYGRKGAQAVATSTKAGSKVEPGSRPQHLPSDLHSKLKALPEPYTWYVLGHDVVLVNRNTHEIVDVVPSVVY